MHVKPDKLDEAVDVYRNSIIPAAREERGYKGKLLFVNSADGKAISITMWSTEEDRIAGETGEYLQAQFAKVEDMFSDEPSIEHFDVSVGMNRLPDRG